MLRLIIGTLCQLENLLYKIISILAIYENRGIHPKHRILNYHKFFVDNISVTDSVLDIGCGNGYVAYDMAQKARAVTGIDIVRSNIAVAEKKFRRENLQYIFGDATTFSFKERFDIITLSNVLEHIQNRVPFLKNIKKLAPKLLIRVPLITRDWISVYKKECGYEYRLDKTHFIEYTEENFQSELKEAGLAIESQYVKFGELYAIVLSNTSTDLGDQKMP